MAKVLPWALHMVMFCFGSEGRGGFQAWLIPHKNNICPGRNLYRSVNWVQWVWRLNSPSEVEPVMWQLLGPQAVCVTENSWRPSPVAGGRPPGPHPGSTRPSQRLSPRAGAGQYRTPSIMFGFQLSNFLSPPRFKGSLLPTPQVPSKCVQPYFFLRTR